MPKSDPQDLAERIAENNLRAMRDELTPLEVAQHRAFFRERGPSDQINEALEERRRMKWLLKLLGMFLLAAPAVLAVGQGFQRLIDWIRGQ